MLCSKFGNVCNDLMDTKANFKIYSAEITQAISVTIDILGYIDLKCSDTVKQKHEGRLAETRRDCSIYFSRLAKLNKSLDGLLSLFQKAMTKFKTATPIEELKCLFNSLVEKYLNWYDQYNDFKQSLKSSKEKWYLYENTVLETIN